MSTVINGKEFIMQQLQKRTIVEKSGLYTSNPINKKHKHSSKAAKAKHKLRQINYEKAIRAYIGYLACNVSENSAFGRARLVKYYKEKKPQPVTFISGQLSTVDTSNVKLKENKMSFDEYRRQNGEMTKFSDYWTYYRS